MVGEILTPREFIIPYRNSGDQPAATISGAFFMSGSSLCFSDGNAVIRLSGAKVK